MYDEFRKLLEEYQVNYLQNKTVQWRDDIAVSGVDIAWKYYQDFHPDSMVPSYLTRRLGKAESERFQILLAHSPLFFDAYAGWGLGGVMTPQYQFFHPFCGGVFEQNGRWMLVSRGLGTHSINIRIGNRPQLAVIRLEPKS